MIKPLGGLLIFRQKGVSLVEIMVALVLSMILLAGVGQIYVGSKQTYRLQDGQARLQENARYALEMLSRDIRKAGSMGCPSTGFFTPLDSRNRFVPIVLANPPMLVPNAIAAGGVLAPLVSGGDNANGRFSNPSPALASVLATSIVKGTDAITVLFAEPCGGNINVAVNSVEDAIANIPNACTSTPGTLLISDCKKAHIFRSNGGNSSNVLKGINDENIAEGYSVGAEVARFRAYTYFIRLNPSGEPALYRMDNNADTRISDELAEGVENMQILYGVDVDNSDGFDLADEYRTATNVTDWSQVVGVRITLTVRSVGYNSDGLTSKPNAVRVFNGENIVDSRLLKDFTLSIKLRKVN